MSNSFQKFMFISIPSSLPSSLVPSFSFFFFLSFSVLSLSLSLSFSPPPASSLFLSLVNQTFQGSQRVSWQVFNMVCANLFMPISGRHCYLGVCDPPHSLSLSCYVRITAGLTGVSRERADTWSPGIFALGFKGLFLKFKYPKGF